MHGSAAVAFAQPWLEIHEARVAVIRNGDRRFNARDLVGRLAASRFHDRGLHIDELDIFAAQCRPAGFVEHIDADALAEYAICLEVGCDRFCEAASLSLRPLGAAD